MKTGDLVQTLNYRDGLSILEIANRLGVCKQAVYSWIKGSEPFDSRHIDLLNKMISEKGFDIDQAYDNAKEIFEEANKIKNQNWKNLILGLQETLNLGQLELLSRIGLRKDFHISEWISGKRIPVLKKKFKIIELVKSLEIEPIELIRFGEHVRSSIKLCGAWISIKDAQNVGNSNLNLLVLKKDKTYLNALSLFPASWNGHLLRFVSQEDKIIVFYNEKRSTTPQPLILSKYISLDDVFLVGLGIYLGEGSRNRKPKVTNSEPLIINQAIRFFGLFGIEKEKLRAWIQLHERSIKNFEEVREFWINNTGLKEENFTGIRIKESMGNSKVKQYGVIHLEASFILLQLLIQRLIDKTLDILTSIPPNRAIPFLQGAFAAEGSVETAKSGSVNTVSYTSTRGDERELIKKLLEKFGIVVHEYKKGFSLRIHGYENLKKLVEINLFKYHPIRNEKLIIGFKSLEKFKKSH